MQGVIRLGVILSLVGYAENENKAKIRRPTLDQIRIRSYLGHERPGALQCFIFDILVLYLCFSFLLFSFHFFLVREHADGGLSQTTGNFCRSY